MSYPLQYPGGQLPPNGWYGDPWPSGPPRTPPPPAPGGIRDWDPLVYRPVSGLGMAAMVAGGFYAAMILIGACVASVGYFSVLSWVWLTTGVAMIAGLFGVAFLLRARRNTQFFDPYAWNTRARAWVSLGWIVPIVCYWFPFQVVRDIAQNTLRRPVGSVLGVWWAGWVSGNVAYNFAANCLAPGESLSGFDRRGIGGLFLIFSAIAIWVAYACWVRIVLLISGEQERRARYLVGASSGPGVASSDGTATLLGFGIAGVVLITALLMVAFSG